MGPRDQPHASDPGATAYSVPVGILQRVQHAEFRGSAKQHHGDQLWTGYLDHERWPEYPVGASSIVLSDYAWCSSSSIRTSRRSSTTISGVCASNSSLDVSPVQTAIERIPFAF